MNEARDTKRVTRVELIDHRRGSETFGRAFVAWDVSADISIQDDGRTLKVFVSDSEEAPKSAKTD